MVMIIKGVKYYPVGRFEDCQHIFYNYNDKCYNRTWDDNHSDESEKALEESERLLDVVDSAPIDTNGIFYATYSDYKIMKDIIVAYRIRHNY